MKKSDKKRMIYDAMALRLAVSLEAFILNRCAKLNDKDKVRWDKKSVLERTNALSPYFGSNMGEIKEKLDKIQGERNNVAHSKGEMGLRPYFNYDQFREFRRTCSELDVMLDEAKGEGKAMEASPMRSIMFHSLQYDMGNAGDLLKHGALSIIVRWWCRHYGTSKNPLRFVDTFGGCPWEEVENASIKKRLIDINDDFVRNCLWDKNMDSNLYYNSVHIVARAVKEVAGKVKAKIYTSDKNEIARIDLEASKWKAPHFKLLGDKHPDFKCEDGYSIFKYANEFNLILIDPYSDFLRYAKKHFNRINNIINENPTIFIMVFILDMYTEQEKKQDTSEGVKRVHDNYCKIRDTFKHCAFSLRCPAITESEVKGESKYDAEILIISKQFETNSKTAELQGELKSYADALAKVLPLHGKEIKFWPEEE